MRLSWFLLAAACLATPVLTSRPGAAAVPDIAFETYRLDNGLEVVLHADHRVPIAHIEIWYKVGSKDEAKGKTGFAHLFEHMMFQGSKHIPEDSYFKYLAEAGASARNGSTNTDRTNYFETLPASQLELGLWMESSRMGFLLERKDGNPERVPLPSRDAALPAKPAGSARERPSLHDSFVNQRDVVKNERRQRVENVPLGAAARLELEALFPPGHPYRHEVIGSMADLDAATEGDLRDFFNHYYAPGNAVLLIAGDFDTAVTKGLVEKYFGPITAGPPIERIPAPAVPTPKAERRLVMEAKINLPRGHMVWTTVPVFAPGDAEMDMLANILGEGKGSRLYQRLVYDLKIAESVSVYHSSRVLGGSFDISYTAMQGHALAEIEKVIDEELDKLRATPPSAEELERARNQIKTNLLRGMEPLSGLAMRLLYYATFAGDPAYLRRDLERYDRATPEILGEWAKRILVKQARVVTRAVPNPKAPIMGRLIDAPVTTKPAGARIPAPATPAPAAPANIPAPKSAQVALRTTPDAPFRDTLPRPGRKQPFKVPAVKRLRLRNGLAVILAESHKLPLVSVNLVVKTGGTANPKDQAGLASLVANMLDEGTKKRTATQIASDIEQLGARLATYATWDASAAWLSVMTENMDRALAVWADVVLNPAFAEDERARVVDNLVSQLAKRKDYPTVVANQVFHRALWGDNHPFAWPDIGTEASLGKLTRAQLRRFYDTYYAPNNSVLVVSGDITEHELRKKIEPLLAGWKSKRVPAIKVAKVEAPDHPRMVLVDKPGAPQSSIRIGLPGIARKNPDYYRALVANNILGGVFKRLTMNLRETKGWTYGVGSKFDARRLAGTWTVSGEFVASHTVDSVVEIGKEIEKLRSQDVTDKELAETKDEIIGAFPAHFATAAELAGQMAILVIYDLPPTELDKFTSKIAAVTRQDVRKTAQKLMRPDNLLTVVVGDLAGNEATLGKLAEVERRDLDGNVIEPAK